MSVTPYYVTCDACSGYGQVQERQKNGGTETTVTRRCSLCGGSGKRQAGQ